MKFYKYHGLGNDYLVLDPAETVKELSIEQIRLICHRNYGVGSDGLLIGPLSGQDRRFVLRVMNPDGSEAEKSGNGNRIFSRYLWDKGRVKDEPFEIMTKGGAVRSQVKGKGMQVTVEMGQACFRADKIPVAGEPREVLNEEISAPGRKFQVFCRHDRESALRDPLRGSHERGGLQVRASGRNRCAFSEPDECPVHEST